MRSIIRGTLPSVVLGAIHIPGPTSMNGEPEECLQLDKVGLREL